MGRLIRLTTAGLSTAVAAGLVAMQSSGRPACLAITRGAWVGLTPADGGSYDRISERDLGLSGGYLRYYSDNARLPDGLSPPYEQPNGVTWRIARQNPFDFSPESARLTGVAHRFLGIDYFAGTHGNSKSVNWVAWSVPLWELALIVGMPGMLLAIKAAVARSRYRRGSCRRCGYDLRASPGMCPECGHTGT